MKYVSFPRAPVVSFALVGPAKPGNPAEPGAVLDGGNPGDATIVVCPTSAHPVGLTDIQ